MRTTERASEFVPRSSRAPAMSANARAGFKAHRERVTFAASNETPPSRRSVSSDETLPRFRGAGGGSSNRFCTASRKSSALRPTFPPPPASAYRADVSNTSTVFSAWPLTRRAPGVLESFAAFTAALRARSTDASVSAARPASRSCLWTLAPPDHTAIHRSKPCGRRGHRGLSWSDALQLPRDGARDARQKRVARVSRAMPGNVGRSRRGAVGGETSGPRGEPRRRLPPPRRARTPPPLAGRARTSQLAASRAVSSTPCASSRMTSAPATSTSIAARTDGSSR